MFARAAKATAERREQEQRAKAEKERMLGGITHHELLAHNNGKTSAMDFVSSSRLVCCQRVGAYSHFYLPIRFDCRVTVYTPHADYRHRGRALRSRIRLALALGRFYDADTLMLGHSPLAQDRFGHLWHALRSLSDSNSAAYGLHRWRSLGHHRLHDSVFTVDDWWSLCLIFTGR